MVKSRLIAILALLVSGLSGMQPLHAAELTITQLEDVDLGEVAPTVRRIQQRTRFCVSSDPAGPFQLTALGSGAAGAFVLSSGAGVASEIDYEVYASGRGASRGRALVPGVARSGFMARPPRPNGDCRPPLTMMTIVIDPSSVQSAPGGQYSGTLQLTVGPE